MTDEIYTAGQVSGITGIHPASIRRYVQDYREFFTEGAQRPSKGRRYSQEDVKRLLLIRHLNQEHRPKETIQAALKGVWAPAAQRTYDTFDALALVDTAKGQMTSAANYAREARQAAQQAQSTVNAANHILNRFNKAIAAREQVPDLIEKVKQLEQRLAAIESKVSMQQQKKGFLDTLLG